MGFTLRTNVSTALLANDPDVFPVLVGQGFAQTKRQAWQSTVKRAYSGREIVVANYSYPRWEWTFGWEIARNSAAYPELATLFGFFGSRGGRALPFYYWDPDDNTVTAQGFGTGDGSTTVFQLYRTVGQGTIYNYLEPVLVLRNSPTIYVNGTPTGVTLGFNGVVTFATAPASGAALTWSGSYLFLCRFLDDQIEPQQMFSNHWSVGKLSFESIKA